GANVADAEAHLPGPLEDGIPRFPHGIPAREQRPARMNAPDVVRVRPDLLHLAELEAFERAVEARIRLDELGLVLVRGQLGHAITRSSPTRPRPGSTKSRPNEQTNEHVTIHSYARRRRARSREDVPEWMAPEAANGGPARREPPGAAGRDPRPARTERRREDHAPVHS